jgi:hypothetical protein
VRFVNRDTDRLDAERIETPLGSAIVTTPEQTLLDLAHRPQVGDARDEVPAGITMLYQRSDRQRLKALAADQRLIASLRCAESWAATQLCLLNGSSPDLRGIVRAERTYAYADKVSSVVGGQVTVLHHFRRDVRRRPAETEFITDLMSSDDRGLR